MHLDSPFSQLSITRLHIVTPQDTGREVRREVKETFALPFNGRNS